MSRHRHQRPRDASSVQLNLAAMLDMAFQLLTFFILTFRPAPVEGQLAMNLPPPVRPQVSPDDATPYNGGGEAAEAPVEVLHVFVTSSPGGQIREIRVGATSVVKGELNDEGRAALQRKLREVLAIDGAFDRVQISAEGQLRYGDLMKVIEVCSMQKKPDGSPLRRISFVEQN